MYYTKNYNSATMFTFNVFYKENISNLDQNSNIHIKSNIRIYFKIHN